ncbi:MAG TPA: peptide deformylase [Actinotalea caeni]|uniref:peptide deformylase n=1 Tax=Actinotalea caeni TaxID=1348467 RepID=UPI002B4B8743|nr:peptide deformylase [Actinotalea caeni]HLV56411.1 peptide deformylase [Actinotalea caeni]
MRTFVQGVEVSDYPEVPPETLRGKVLRVTEVGEEVLHRRNADVPEEMFGTEELRTLVDDMFTTMAVAEGVGLAANQVGVDLRLFVYDLPDTDDDARHVGHICNPVVEVDPSAGTNEHEEGCLSVPGPGADLFRPSRVVVTGTDIEGAPLRIEGTGYFARCLQHETDHTNGRLYIDLLAKRERKRVLADMLELRDRVIERRTRLARELDREPAEYPAQPPSAG